MSLTLGLNTALSGLLTSQRGLDVIAQNVVNVNTEGYTRKVMTPESRVLSGKGAGVQEGNVIRNVHEGLLKDIRRHNATLGKLEVEQSYLPRIDDLFGNVGADTSISHQLQGLMSAFEVLGTEVNKPAVQWGAVQAGIGVAEMMGSMSESLQNLRQEADNEIETTVADINELVANIHDLNQRIVKNYAVSTGVSDLQDKRDGALSELAKLVDIEYFNRADGGVAIYTGAGAQLLDAQPTTLTYSATTSLQAWMSADSGHFDAIDGGGQVSDLTELVRDGKLKALLDLRDVQLPNMQAELDNLAANMRTTLNAVHNRGTSQPNISNSYSGTRVFAKQGDIVPDAADAVAVMYQSGTAVAHGGLAFTAGNATYPWQATLTATNPVFTAANFPDGTVFTLDGTDTARNAGTYRVVSRLSNTQVVVEKVNPRQTIELGGTDDVVIATFDSEGDQLAQSTLDTIMQTDYSADAADATVGQSAADFTAKDSRGPWSIQEVAVHLQSWLRAQNYDEAVVALDDDGKLSITLNEDSVSLAFRDQGSSTAGADATDATINFDVNGDGDVDQTVSGFSNFFGLNDFFVSEVPNSILDSAITSKTYATSKARDLTLYDATGQIGNQISIPAGSSLQDIADAINAQTRTNESVPQSTDNFTLTTSATISISDGSAVLASTTVAPGTVTLYEIAGKLSTNGITGSVVREGDDYRLRFVQSNGKELTVTITGGDLPGSVADNLDQALGMNATTRIQASVVREGSGERLRLVHSDNTEIYSSSTLDGGNKNLLTDLGLGAASVRSADSLSVRADLQSAPERISRGMMQYDSEKAEYLVSPGDNTAALALGEAMSSKVSTTSAGNIYAGEYTFAEYASTSISISARGTAQSATQYGYHKTFGASLDFQHTSFSGVNLDEEVSKMIDFQQAYAASAKVITTLQDMLETLTSMIR